MRHLFFLLFFVTNSIFATQIDLRDYEKKYYSEHGEDGVTEKIFQIVGTTSKYFVEFGVQNGAECNTRYFREYHGWNGLLMDCDFSNPSINFHKEFITAENICALFEKYNVPQEFDLLSIDIDGMDYYVWENLSKQYRPRVVIVEFNPNFNPAEDKVIVYNPNHCWDKTSYFGASMLALYKLGRKLGYSLVNETSTCNLFFIRDDVLQNANISFKYTNSVEGLYERLANLRKIYPQGFHTPDKLARPYISSDEIP